jgi:hypothetical protein
MEPASGKIKQQLNPIWIGVVGYFFTMKFKLVNG